jgi:hypothetical protein
MTLVTHALHLEQLAIYAPQPPLFGRVWMSDVFWWVVVAPFIAATAVMVVVALIFVFALIYTTYDVWRNG